MNYKLKKIINSNLHPDLKKLRLEELKKNRYYRKYPNKGAE